MHSELVNEPYLLKRLLNIRFFNVLQRHSIPSAVGISEICAFFRTGDSD